MGEAGLGAKEVAEREPVERRLRVPTAPADHEEGAAILEGIHYRYTLGQTVGAGFDRIGALVPVFIDRGLTILKED